MPLPERDPVHSSQQSATPHGACPPQPRKSEPHCPNLATLMAQPPPPAGEQITEKCQPRAKASLNVLCPCQHRWAPPPCAMRLPRSGLGLRLHVTCTNEPSAPLLRLTTSCSGVTVMAVHGGLPGSKKEPGGGILRPGSPRAHATLPRPEKQRPPHATQPEAGSVPSLPTELCLPKNAPHAYTSGTSEHLTVQAWRQVRPRDAGQASHPVTATVLFLHKNPFPLLLSKCC